jgi:hypothetical protein
MRRRLRGRLAAPSPPAQETFRTFAEAHEAKGNRDAGDRRPVARVRFEDYFEAWIESYAGRTARGFWGNAPGSSTAATSSSMLPRWGRGASPTFEPADVRELFSALHNDGVSTSVVKGVRAALSAMFATAVEDRLLRSNPVQGERIPAARVESRRRGRRRRSRAPSWCACSRHCPRGGGSLRVPDAHRAQDLGDQLKSRHGSRDLLLSPRMAERLRALRRDRTPVNGRGRLSSVPAAVANTGASIRRPDPSAYGRRNDARLSHDAERSGQYAPQELPSSWSPQPRLTKDIRRRPLGTSRLSRPVEKWTTRAG